MDIAKNINNINEQIINSCKRVGRSPSEITLIGVTKNQPIENIITAINYGINDIGENRVQELLDKMPKIPSGTNIHLIGHLQTNKVKYIITHVNLIHSIDSIKLAQEVSKQSAVYNKNSDVLLQVNVSGEESKFGISPNELGNLLEVIEGLHNIKVCGLMTMAPLSQDKEASRVHFRNLYKIFIDIRQKKYHNIYMEHLSMGMSNDFTIAIEEGATLIRVGSAMFL